MSLALIANSDQPFIEGMPATQLLRSPEDLVPLIGTCFEHDIRSVLLYAENLTARFFDLSSGEAGTILQKLKNYHIKVALVLTPGAVWQSTPFRAMMFEQGRGDDFRLFAHRAAAEAWLRQA